MLGTGSRPDELLSQTPSISSAPGGPRGVGNTNTNTGNNTTNTGVGTGVGTGGGDNRVRSASNELVSQQSLEQSGRGYSSSRGPTPPAMGLQQPSLPQTDGGDGVGGGSGSSEGGGLGLGLRQDGGGGGQGQGQGQGQGDRTPIHRRLSFLQRRFDLELQQNRQYLDDEIIQNMETKKEDFENEFHKFMTTQEEYLQLKISSLRDVRQGDAEPATSSEHRAKNCSEAEFQELQKKLRINQENKVGSKKKEFHDKFDQYISEQTEISRLKIQAQRAAEVRERKQEAMSEKSMSEANGGLWGGVFTLFWCVF